MCKDKEKRRDKGVGGKPKPPGTTGSALCSVTPWAVQPGVADPRIPPCSAEITAHRRTFAKKTGLIPLGLLFLPVSGGSLGEQSQVHVACKPPVMRDIVCCSPLLGLASPFCLLTKSCPGPSPLEEGRGIWEAGFAAYPQCWNKNAPWVNSRNPV